VGQLLTILDKLDLRSNTTLIQLHHVNLEDPCFTFDSVQKYLWSLSYHYFQVVVHPDDSTSFSQRDGELFFLFQYI
jgi:hypothetical protein